jgi:hypothetical protein
MYLVFCRYYVRKANSLWLACTFYFTEQQIMHWKLPYHSILHSAILYSILCIIFFNAVISGYCFSFTVIFKIVGNNRGFFFYNIAYMLSIILLNYYNSIYNYHSMIITWNLYFTLFIYFPFFLVPVYIPLTKIILLYWLMF